MLFYNEKVRTGAAQLLKLPYGAGQWPPRHLPGGQGSSAAKTTGRLKPRNKVVGHSAG